MSESKELRLLLGTVSVVGMAALAGPVMAQSTDTLTVLASVSSECSVTGAKLDLGAYSGTAVDVDIPISFNCNAPTNIAISMDSGRTTDPNGRLMINEDSSS